MQAEGIASSPVGPNDLLVGHHDNGLARNTPAGAWIWSPGSNEEDMPFFDPNDPTGLSAYYYDASQADFHKSTDGGNSFCTIPCGGAYAAWNPSVVPISFALAFFF